MCAAGDNSATSITTLRRKNCAVAERCCHCCHFSRVTPEILRDKERSACRSKSLCRCTNADPNVRAWRVLNRLHALCAWFSGGDRTAGMFRSPFFPHRPPGGLYEGCALEPLFRTFGKLRVVPVTVRAAGRVDDPGNVARLRENELDRAAVKPGCRIGRPPGGDVILPRGHHESRGRDSRQVDRDPSETDPT
jgi:hypothetical protein